MLNSQPQALVGCIEQSLGFKLFQLQQGIKDQNVGNEALTKPLLNDEFCKKILLELQYEIAGDEINAPKELPQIFDEVYWVVIALYGD